MEELGLGPANTLEEMNKSNVADKKAAFSTITKHQRTEDDFGLVESDVIDAEVDWAFLGNTGLLQMEEVDSYIHIF